VFVRSCGATTPFVTEISVIVPHQHLSEVDTGNVFIGESDHGKVRTGVHGELSVQVTWLTDKSLQITYPQHTRIFYSKATMGDNRISYLEAESNAQ
jgi:hypothetical protein